jgi:hypothetical protein
MKTDTDLTVSTPSMLDVPAAARMLGIGRTLAYELVGLPAPEAAGCHTDRSSGARGLRQHPGPTAGSTTDRGGFGESVLGPPGDPRRANGSTHRQALRVGEG